MKKILLILTAFFPLVIAMGQNIIFTDASFKWALIRAGIDLNTDNEISIDEAEQVTKINVKDESIVSVDGIDHFINLDTLICSFNDIERLTINNLNLTYLDCQSNEIDTLELNGLNNLVYLNCIYNSLDSLHVDGIPNIKEIRCSYNHLFELNLSSLASLEGLLCNNNRIRLINVEGLNNLKSLLCHSNQLVGLDASNLSSLASLNCQNNMLESLNVEGDTSLFRLDCYENNLGSLELEGLKNLNTVHCYGNKLTHIDVKGLHNLKGLYCQNNLLEALDISDLTGITHLECAANQLSYLNTQALRNIHTLSCGYNQISVLNTANLSTMVILRCHNNRLFELDIRGCSSLRRLTTSDNLLHCILMQDSTNSVPNETFFMGNNPLKYICADSSELDELHEVLANNNYENVSLSTYCGDFCPSYAFKVGGIIKYDLNGNGCDEDDPGLRNVPLEIVQNSNSKMVLSNLNGDYSAFLDSGSSSITVLPYLPWDVQTTPENVEVVFPQDTNHINQEFCIQPQAPGVYSDLKINLIPTSVLRPGELCNYHIICENGGSDTAFSSIQINYQDDYLTPDSSHPVFTSDMNGIITWDNITLYPFEKREIYLTLRANKPGDLNPLNGGETIQFEAEITPHEQDLIPEDNFAALAQTVVNSYDPNDKTCLEGVEVSPEIIGEYVHYVIRFENNGTAEAINIIITDSINTSLFDIESIQLLASSHAVHTSIDQNVLTFFFDDIDLPHDSSTNKGYVAFKVRTRGDLQVGDSLTNKANIYFDYNAPIITNETETFIRVLVANESVFPGLEGMSCFPNPVKQSEYLKIQLPDYEKNVTVNIYTIEGIQVYAGQGKIVNTKDLNPGFYQMKVVSDKEVYSTTFVVH